MTTTFPTGFNWQKLQIELETAQTVHLNLFPKTVPSFAGIEIGAATRAASHVGGDFYDFIRSPDGPLTFVVADISGKGIPAAMLMGATRAIIRGEANDPGAPVPELILSRSNEKLYEDFTRAGMLATVFIGQWQPAWQELRYVNAGHSPVIYHPAGGEAALISADGPAVGVLLASLSREQRLRFCAGDILVVGTDGLYEGRRLRSKLFGFSRLAELTRQFANRPAQEIADGVLAGMQEFRQGEELEDDQTLVVLKCTGG